MTEHNCPEQENMWLRLFCKIGKFFKMLAFGFCRFMERLGVGIKNRAIRFGRSITEFFKSIYHRFQDGSIYTKLSHLVFGTGNLARGQIVKGLLYLAIEVGFILYMVLAGGKALVDFGTLGTQVGHDGIDDEGYPTFIPGDNSLLCLLYGVLAIFIIAAFVYFYFSNVKSSYHLDLLQREGKHIPSFREDCKKLLDDKFHITMLSPAIVGILLFTVIPIVFMIFIAFTNMDKNHPTGVTLSDWVGFVNFGKIFNLSDPSMGRFFPVLLWTLCWAVLATGLNYIAGIIVAMMINRKSIKLKSLFRTILILTIAIPQFVTLLTIRKMLGVDGPINGLLMNTGLIQESIHFFDGSPWTARAMVVLINMWVGIPYTMLITSGILMNIPEELYEAAKVDGANVFVMFIKITIPYVLFITAPYLITQFIGNINNFNVIYLLTGGGPNPNGGLAGETDLLITWLFKLTIDEQNYNVGSVIGIYTFIICAVFSLITYRHTTSYKKEDAFQ